MFENPLNKYAAGGTTMAEQQAEEDFINAIAQQLGQNPEDVRARFEEIKSNPEESRQLHDAVQVMQTDKKKGVQLIVNLFTQTASAQPTSMRDGGKFRDFICKHGKGGKTDCGCSPKEKLAGMENGDKVEKHQNSNGVIGKRSVSSGKFDVPFLAYMKAYFNSKRTPTVGAAMNRKFGHATQNGNEYYLEQASINGTSADTWVNVTPKKDTIIMQKLPSEHLTPLDSYDREAIMQRMRPDIQRVSSKQGGGNVDIFGRVTPYQRPVSTTPMDSSKVAYNPLFKALNFKDINGNDVSWSRLRDGSYSYRNGPDIMFFNPNQVDGFIPFGKFKAWNVGTTGSTRLSEKDLADLQNLEAKTKSKAKSKENGGKVEKAQDGSILDYYTNKWSNDLNRIRSGWNKFKESAPGKVWGAFMPNPNSESGMLGAAAPVGKISSLGKAASKLDDEVKVLGYYDELGNFIKTEGDDVIRNTGDYMNKTKWPEFEMPEYNQPNFIETDYSGIDFNNITMPHANLEDWLIGGGITAALGGAAYAGAKMAESETKDKKENKSGSKSAEKKQSGGLIDFYKNKWSNDFFE